jgi:hypothetical protein
VNIKNGLNRVWIVVSVLWVGWVLFNSLASILDKDKDAMVFMASLGVGGLLLWWGGLYIGFWIFSGFSSDNEKKGETDE